MKKEEGRGRDGVYGRQERINTERGSKRSFKQRREWT